MSKNEINRVINTMINTKPADNAADWYCEVAEQCFDKCAEGKRKNVFKRVYEYFKAIKAIPHAVERMSFDNYRRFCSFGVILIETVKEEFGGDTCKRVFGQLAI